jgi:hypothetical protein
MEVCIIYLVLFFIFLFLAFKVIKAYFHMLFFPSLLLSQSHSFMGIDWGEKNAKESYFVLLFFLPSGCSLLLMWLLTACVCLCIRKRKIDRENETLTTVVNSFCNFQIYTSMPILHHFEDYNLCWRNLNYFNYIKVVCFFYFLL